MSDREGPCGVAKARETREALQTEVDKLVAVLLDIPLAEISFGSFGIAELAELLHSSSASIAHWAAHHQCGWCVGLT